MRYEFELTRTITQSVRVTIAARDEEDAVARLQARLDDSRYLDGLAWAGDSEEVDYDGPLDN